MAASTRRLLTAAAMLVIVAAALLLRLPHLGDRPFHGDEAVHAVKFRDLWKQGRYEYDPNEYHGPTLYYAALPVVALLSRTTFAQVNEADYRLAVALIGAFMVLLYLLLRDAIGLPGVLFASLLTAVSSPFVFYSRYFIQEMVLVAFTLMLIGCGWRYRVSGRPPWLMAAAVAAGLMIATKETCVLTFAAMFAGWLALRTRAGAAESGNERKGRARLLLAAAGVGIAVAYLLLSGFLSHPAGPLGYFETYMPWLKRAGGTDLHRHPWHYYLSLLGWSQSKSGTVWTELPLIVLAIVGATAGASKGVAEKAGVEARFARFILVYSVALTAIYSLIPYKTPWNLLSFYLGWVILAGIGAAVLLSLIPKRTVAWASMAIALLATGALGWQSQRTTFQYRDDQMSPYAYAQPTRGVREIEKRINELAEFSLQKDQTVAQIVFQDDYHWPLPWYLRRLKNIGYWTGRVPDESQARLKGTPIILSSSNFDEELTARLSETHFMIGFHTLREGVLVQMWVKNELWEPFIMSQSEQRPPAQ